MVIALVLVFVGIIVSELPELLRKKLWGELAVFSVLLAIGFVLSLLQVLGVKVPSPNKGIELLIKGAAKIMGL